MQILPEITTPGHGEETLSTHERILKAAAQVCADRGLHRATTREIAEAAHVNEVTLFRHFGNKEKLIAALLEQAAAAQSQSLAGDETETNDLAVDLNRYAQRFNEMLFANQGLIRTIIGEARQYPDQERQIIFDSGRALRARLLAYLQAAQASGRVRREIALSPTIDAFKGMLLAGMLRRTGFATCLDYSQEEYVATVVDLFVRSIATPPPA